jgi:hypothetical protein
MELRGSVAFSGDDSIAAGALPSVHQLAMHLIAQWPRRFRLTIGADVSARREALQSILVDRGVPARRIEIVSDASIRGSRVVVTVIPAQD